MPVSLIEETIVVNLIVDSVPTGALKPWAKNARTHSKMQIRQLANSIQAFGFTVPVLIDDDNSILAGHCRVSAAALLDMKYIPCIRVKHLTDTQKRAYVIADNKLAQNADWDIELLAQEFEAVLSLDPDFDIGLTGFSVAEIDLVLDMELPDDAGDPADDIAAHPEEGLPDCFLGDIWALGPHRLICGNALDANHVRDLMDGQHAKMIFTDPPYNVPIDGHVCGSGSIKHREFAFASGEMSPSEFTDFLRTSIKNMIAHSLPGSIHYIFMDWRHVSEILTAGEEYTEFKNMIVWVKDNGGMGTFYRSRHELIFVFKHGKVPHMNNFELGQHGRYRTNVWEYRGMNSMTTDRLKTLALHPTVKPVQMIADAIKDVSARGDIVLDIFGGSGSTMIAAHKTGRRAFLCEVDPIYCGRIIKRWETYAHDEAVLLHRSQNAEDFAKDEPGSPANLNETKVATEKERG